MRLLWWVPCGKLARSRGARYMAARRFACRTILTGGRGTADDLQYPSWIAAQVEDTHAVSTNLFARRCRLAAARRRNPRCGWGWTEARVADRRRAADRRGRATSAHRKGSGPPGAAESCGVIGRIRL